MRVLLAGATGAIGRPLILGLKQHRDCVFGFVHSAKSSQSTHILTEVGAEALIGDALDAASVRAAVARVRPNAVINELTALPRHCTPAEMKAAAESDTRVRREGNVNLLAVMREAGVRRYVLQSSGFWYAPGPGLADESSLQAVDASPGVAAGARTYVELESTDFRVSEIDRVAMRYGFFYGPGTCFTNADDMGEQLRPQQVPVSGAGQGVASFVHIEDAASTTVTALECAPGPYNIVDDNPSQCVRPSGSNHEPSRSNAGGLHHLLLTISEHACSGTSNVRRILMAKSHPNHNATRKVSAQPRLHQRAREIQAYSSVSPMLPLELEEPVRLEMTEQLNQLLADTMTLRDLYKKSHWQVAGPTFYQLHLLYDKHYGGLHR